MFAEIEIEDEDTKKKERLKVAGLTSVPRLAFTAHSRVVQQSLSEFNIPLYVMGGMWWEQAMQNGLNQIIKAGADIIITIDFDTLFFPKDLRTMLVAMIKFPQIDALVPWQLKRGDHNQSLFGMSMENGEPISILHPSLFMSPITPIDIGHFGLTIFRTKAFKDLPKPWFLGVPNKQGEWSDGKTNADIYFWNKFKEHKKKAYLINSVSLGHIDEMVLALDKNFQIRKYAVGEFLKEGGVPMYE